MRAVATGLLFGFLAVRGVSAQATDTALAQLAQNRDQLQGVSFADVIKATTGHRVLPVVSRQQARLLAQLGEALDAAVSALNQADHPIHAAGRVNEASRFIEDEVRKQVNALPGWKCSVPLTAQGREQRSGYPDLRIETDGGTIFYLDPKLYEASSRQSSLRTFYYEPKSLTGKIHDDAMHLVVGLAHTGSTARDLKLESWELVDLSKLKVQLKAEFQAGNRDVYRPENIVGHSKN